MTIALDVAPLTPEAQPIAAAAAEVYLRHTRPWFVGLLAHGSALKGGYIPGCSDLDLQLHLEPAAFSEDGALPFERCAAIQRELARIDPYPFAYIQCYAHPCALPAGQVGPIPGAYALLAGRLPIPEATADELMVAARSALEQLWQHPAPNYLRHSMLEHGDGRLERHVRLLCTDVWPALYQALALRSGDPLAAWRLPKAEAIAAMPATEPVGYTIRAFDAAARAYYPDRPSVEAALNVLRTGLAFRHAVARWWSDEQHHLF